MARSDDHDPLTGLPVSIRLNPLRDRTIEHTTNQFLRELRDGHCDQLLSEWESAPPLAILHYRGKRRYGKIQAGTYQELFTVTTENKDGQWVVTKYDAMY